MSATMSRASSWRRDFLHAPVLGQLDGGPGEIAAVLLELDLEAGEQGEGVRGGPGEAGQDVPLVEAADLLGRLFEDGLAHGHLAVGGHGRFPLVPDADDGRRADHGFTSRVLQ